jgi:hypothetical protein
MTLKTALKRKQLSGLNATIMDLMEKEKGDILKVNAHLKDTYNVTFSENALRHRLQRIMG